jgi:hypothetical protein
VQFAEVASLLCFYIHAACLSITPTTAIVACILLQALEAALAEQRHTVSQLRAAAAAAQGEHQAAVAGLLEELADKSSQLVDAERRFSQLEALIGRIASRTGGVQGIANGMRQQQQQQQQRYQVPQMQRPSSAQGSMSGGGAAAAAGRLAGQQPMSAGSVGGGLGLAAMKQHQQQQQWEQQQQQQGLLSSLRGSRDQQQQGIRVGWGAAESSVLGSAGGYRGSASGGGAGY